MAEAMTGSSKSSCQSVKPFFDVMMVEFFS